MMAHEVVGSAVLAVALIGGLDVEWRRGENILPWHGLS
jgi:hypothetical protein